MGASILTEKPQELWRTSQREARKQTPPPPATCRISSSIFKGQGCALKASLGRSPNMRRAPGTRRPKDLKHLRHHHAELHDLLANSRLLSAKIEVPLIL